MSSARRGAPVWKAALAASLCFITVACAADKNFLANDEDSRRLSLVHRDPAYTYLHKSPVVLSAPCQESLAHYEPSDGSIFSFAGVTDTAIDCNVNLTHPGAGMGLAVDSETNGFVSVALAAGWIPAAPPVPALDPIKFYKAFGTVWVTMTVETSDANQASHSLGVGFRIPQHTYLGFSMTPQEEASGRACIAGAQAGRPLPGCPLSAPPTTVLPSMLQVDQFVSAMQNDPAFTMRDRSQMVVQGNKACETLTHFAPNYPLGTAEVGGGGDPKGIYLQRVTNLTIYAATYLCPQHLAGVQSALGQREKSPK